MSYIPIDFAKYFGFFSVQCVSCNKHKWALVSLRNLNIFLLLSKLPSPLALRLTNFNLSIFKHFTTDQCTEITTFKITMIRSTDSFISNQFGVAYHINQIMGDVWMHTLFISHNHTIVLIFLLG